MPETAPDDWAERLPDARPVGRDDPLDDRVRIAEPSDLTWLVVQKMRYLRMSRGMSAQELERRMADTAGVVMSRAVITNLENQRRRDMTVDQLVGLTKVFETTIEFMLGWGSIECARCLGEPPAGFACMACGAQGTG